MPTEAAAFFRLRFRFSPPPLIPEGKTEVKLHVEVINECGQGVSSMKAHPHTPNIPGWTVAVGTCDAATCAPISSSTSITKMAPSQSHCSISVSVPNASAPFRFHAHVHTSSTTTDAPLTASLRSFACAQCVDDHTNVLVLPVWSHIVARSEPCATVNPPSVSSCLRRFSIHRPGGPIDVAVEERYGDAMASHAWDAGICLSFFLQTQYFPHLSPTTPLRAVEIAAGCGLLGLVLATLLPPHSTLALTDKPSSLDLLRHNLRQVESTTTANVSVCALEWGNAAHLRAFSYHDHATDLVVLADVLYNWAAHPQLWATVAAIASPTTTIYLAHKHRTPASTAAFGHLQAHGTCPTCAAGSSATSSSCGWQTGVWKLEHRASYGATDIFQLLVLPRTT